MSVVFVPERQAAAAIGDYITTLGEYALAEASRRLGVRILGGRAKMHGPRSVHARVEGADGTQAWLKVTGLHGLQHNELRVAEIEAERLTSLPKPRTLRLVEWNDDNIFWRGQLMTVAPSPAGSVFPWREPGGIRPSDAWLMSLKAALQTLSCVPTKRRLFKPEQVQNLIAVYLAPRAPTHAWQWRVTHGDLSWSNVTVPNLSLLDWEIWGRAPRGYGAARLLALSVLDPELTARLEATFADDFATPSGLVAQLAAIALVKCQIRGGEVPQSLSVPLDRLAERVLSHVELPRPRRSDFLWPSPPELANCRHWR